MNFHNFSFKEPLLIAKIFRFRQIRECLKLNPEHKKCFPHYKKLKKLVKQQENVKNSIQKKEWQNCIDGVQEVLKTESNVAAIVLETKEYLCKCLSQVRVRK